MCSTYPSRAASLLAQECEAHANALAAASEAASEAGWKAKVMRARAEADGLRRERDRYRTLLEARAGGGVLPS